MMPDEVYIFCFQFLILRSGAFPERMASILRGYNRPAGNRKVRDDPDRKDGWARDSPEKE
jgi:hypothetical protein